MTCMAIAAFASFVIAPSASATTLTESGSSLAVGASIEGENKDIVEFTGGVIVTCSNALLKGKLTQNNTTGPVKGEIPVGSASYSGTGTNGDCTSNLFGGSAKVTVNSKLCFEAGPSDILKVTGCGGNVTFSHNFTGTGTCKYETSSVAGTYTTNSTPAVGSLVNQVAKGESTNPFFCPAESYLTIQLNFYTTNSATGLTFS